MPFFGYTDETKEAVRKWLGRFFEGDDVRAEFWSRVEDFRRKNNFDPKVNDVIWGMLNERRGLFFKEGNLGLYRNETLAMCTLLDIEERHPERLTNAIHLTTLDACGAANVGWAAPGGGPLRLKEAFIGPICAALLVDCAQNLLLSCDELQAKFVEVSEKQLT